MERGGNICTFKHALILLHSREIWNDDICDRLLHMSILLSQNIFNKKKSFSSEKLKALASELHLISIIQIVAL